MDAIDRRFLVSPDLFEQEEWVIEVQWGFGTKWSVLRSVDLHSEDEANRTIAAIRKLAASPDAPVTAIGYRDLPMRAALKEPKLEAKSE